MVPISMVKYREKNTDNYVLIYNFQEKTACLVNQIYVLSDSWDMYHYPVMRWDNHVI